MLFKSANLYAKFLFINFMKSALFFVSALVTLNEVGKTVNNVDCCQLALALNVL